MKIFQDEFSFKFNAKKGENGENSGEVVKIEETELNLGQGYLERRVKFYKFWGIGDKI